uniref:Endo/exonuclease/phosphatase domain-containing protein n=1 Tax=Haemonchus contortus TaxID=6289 RepID=A0A7I4Z8H6_HAECO
MMAICTLNARKLASEVRIEDLMTQARNIKYDVIGLTDTRRCRSLHANLETAKELFHGTCNSRGVCGVGVLVPILAYQPSLPSLLGYWYHTRLGVQK